MRLVRVAGAAFALGALLLVNPGSALAATPSLPTPSTAFSGGAPLPPAPASGLSRNEDGEPGIAVDGGGTIWVGSDINPNGTDPRVAQVLSGEDVWKSTDGGQTYQWVADPFATASPSSPGLGGEDSDISAAPVKNANGFYNVYALSLWVGSTTLAISQDGGKTWTLDPLSGIPVEDRPWVAAAGACTVYVAYHQISGAETPFVNSYNLCSPSAGLGTTLNPVSSAQITLASYAGGNTFGKIAVDNSPGSPEFGDVYVPIETCDLTGPSDYIADQTSTGCPGKTQMVLAVSTDGGTTFTDDTVALGDTGGSLPIWPATVASDASGRIYVAWFDDNQHTYLNTSSDGGATWSKTVTVNSPSVTSVYPTVAAGAPGQVDVAFYGTTTVGNGGNESVMGVPNAPGAAQWQVYMAESTDSGKTFTEAPVTGLIHTGALCTGGDSCASDGSRNLLDDFGNVIDPATGYPAVAYTSDQPQGTSVTAFTGYTTQTSPLAGGPGPSVPEAPLAIGVPVTGLVIAGLLVRRRRALSPARA